VDSTTKQRAVDLLISVVEIHERVQHGRHTVDVRVLLGSVAIADDQLDVSGSLQFSTAENFFADRECDCVEHVHDESPQMIVWHWRIVERRVFQIAGSTALLQFGEIDHGRIVIINVGVELADEIIQRVRLIGSGHRLLMNVLRNGDEVLSNDVE